MPLPLTDAVTGTVAASLAARRQFPLCRIDLTVVAPPHRFQLLSFARAWNRWMVTAIVQAELS